MTDNRSEPVVGADDRLTKSTEPLAPQKPQALGNFSPTFDDDELSVGSVSTVEESPSTAVSTGTSNFSNSPADVSDFSTQEVQTTEIDPPLERDSEPIGLWWELVAIVPVAVALIPGFSSIMRLWEVDNLRIALVCSLCSVAILITLGRYRGVRKTSQSGLAFGSLACGLFCGTASWLSTAAAWPLLAIAFSIVGWALLRLLGERPTRSIVVAIWVVLPSLFSVGILQGLVALSSRVSAWTASGIMDLFTIAHLRNLAVIELGRKDIDFAQLAQQWSGVTAAIAIAGCIQILFRRSLFSSLVTVLASVFCWIAVASVAMTLFGNQIVGEGSISTSWLFDLTSFLVMLLGILCFDQFVGAVCAPIRMGKFDSDLPVLTQLWNLVVAFPEPPMKLVRVGDAEFEAAKEQDEIELPTKML